jgi:pimeloyl-ACP methyl ester carboxylesterase
MPTWEEWTDDILAVMDGAGSSRTAIMAADDAGPTAILFAAMHPEKVNSLVLVNTSARYLVGDDYPIGASPEQVDALVATMATQWGSPNLTRTTSPSLSEDPEEIRLRAMVTRVGSPDRRTRRSRIPEIPNSG